MPDAVRGEDHPLILWRKGQAPFEVGCGYESELTEEEALQVIGEVVSRNLDFMSDLIYHLAVHPAGRNAVKKTFEDLRQQEIVRLTAASALAQRGDSVGVEYAKQVLSRTDNEQTAAVAASTLFFTNNVRELASLYLDNFCTTQVGRDAILRQLEDKTRLEYRNQLPALVDLFKCQSNPVVKGTLGHQFERIASIDQLIAFREQESDATTRLWLLEAIDAVIRMQTKRSWLEDLMQRTANPEVRERISKRLAQMATAVEPR